MAKPKSKSVHDPELPPDPLPIPGQAQDKDMDSNHINARARDKPPPSHYVPGRLAQTPTSDGVDVHGGPKPRKNTVRVYGI
jgi:hypothetical protein